MKLIAFLGLLAVASIALGRESYLFGRSADEAFGNFWRTNNPAYTNEAATAMRNGWRPLKTTLGAERPTPLKIYIKDAAIDSQVTRAYVEALASEKGHLMSLYRLSNVEYNQLAAIAFGILGRETKFGTSIKYLWKETNQSEIWQFKLAKKKLRDSVKAVETRDASKFFAWKTWKVAPNSRGLTQIKAVPETIEQDYCINEENLNDPRMTAVATVGFLAESLKILKNRVRNRELMYINDANLFDYVLYVYFGSMRQLVNPILDYKTASIINEVATPARNLYIQTVRRHMQALALFELPGANLVRQSEYACRN